MKKQIKVCGMRDAENIRAVEALGVELIGLIFYPKSPRFLDELPRYLPTRAQRVGVFVNETKEHVLTYADRYDLAYIQLHGEESPDYCRSLQRAGMKLIKACSIGQRRDLAAALAYEEVCDYLLFDTPCSEHGGSGQVFDWGLLESYQGTTPFLLSGGLHVESAPTLQQLQHPRLAGFDLNSRFEIEPGLKDVARISTFLNNLRSNHY